MNRIQKRILILTLLATVASTGEALAYVDPGSGSLLVQLVVAGAVGGVFYLKKYLKALTGLLRPAKPEKNDLHD